MGFACLADDTWGLPIFFFVGGDHHLGKSIIRGNNELRGETSEVNAQAHDKWFHDIISTAIVEPILMHDLSSCYSSKKTTILPDLGVD